MNRYILFTLLVCACSIPDVDDIHLSECLAPCSGAKDLCMGVVRARVTYCDDIKCARWLALKTDECWGDYTDCAEQCIADAEEALK